MLVKLRKFGIQANVNKYKFHITETKYLGLIISKNGIKMDLAKVEAIKNWSTFRRVKDICVFIRFCNFYCWFIQSFLKVAEPLNSLTKKNTAFVWSVEYKKAFQELKRQACKALILKLFDLNKQCFVKTNSSNYVNTGVLSQQGDDSLLHSVAYFSCRMAPADCNYKIYNKELLAIICYFKEW